MAQIDFNDAKTQFKKIEKQVKGNNKKSNLNLNKALEFLQGKNAKYVVGFIVYLVLSGLVYNVYLLIHPLYLLIYILSLVSIISIILLIRFIKSKLSKKSKKTK